jgi:hypothetical protein
MASGLRVKRQSDTVGRKTMDINWHITADDKACVKAILEEQRNKELVLDRYKRNLAEIKPPVMKDAFWQTIICMRLTTLASSSPESKIGKFQSVDPFPLAFDTTCREQFREKFIHSTLSTHDVGTYRKRISKELTNNLKILEDGGWQRALDQCNRLIRLQCRETEAEVADYIDDTFEGFGPKQSRNVLQELGLTRYEIPIDGRVMKWLNDDLKFPFKVTPTALSEKYCYKFILDAFCKLCAECEPFPFVSHSAVYPCVLDAAIFSAQDVVSH